jgi:hypothetical protein
VGITRDRLLDLNHALWCCHRIGQPIAIVGIERDHGSLETGRRPLVRARRHRLEATCCATRSPSNGKEPDAQPNDQRTEP